MTARRASYTARLGNQARTVDGLSLSHGFVLDGGGIPGLDGSVQWADSAPVSVPPLPTDEQWDRGPGLPLTIDWTDEQGTVRVATARLDGSAGDGLNGVSTDLTDWTSRLETVCEIRPFAATMNRNPGLPGSVKRRVNFVGTWLTAEAMRQAGFHPCQAMQTSAVAYHSMGGSLWPSPDPDTTAGTMGEIRQAYRLNAYGDVDVTQAPGVTQGDDMPVMRNVYLLGMTRTRRRSSVAHWQMTQDLGTRTPEAGDIGRSVVRPLRSSDGAGMRLDWDATDVRVQRVNTNGTVATLGTYPRGTSMRWSLVIRANGTATVYNDLQGSAPVAQLTGTGVTALPTGSGEASYLVEAPGRVGAFQLTRSDSPFLVTQSVGAHIGRSSFSGRWMGAVDWIRPTAAGSVLALQAKAEVGWRGIGLLQWIDEDGRLQNHDFYRLASAPIAHVLTTQSSGADALSSASWSVPGHGPWQGVSVVARRPRVHLRDQPTLPLGEGSRETVPRGETLEQVIHPQQDQTWLHIDTSAYLTGHPYQAPTNKEYDNQHGTWVGGHKVDEDGQPAGWITVADVQEWSLTASGEVRNALRVVDPATVVVSGTVNTPVGLSMSTMPSPASKGLPEHRKSQPLAQIRGAAMAEWSVESVDVTLSGDDRHQTFTHDGGMFLSNPVYQEYAASELAASVSNPAVIFEARVAINPRVRVGQKVALRHVYASGWTRTVVGVVAHRRIDLGGGEDVMVLRVVRTSDSTTAPAAPLPPPDPTPPAPAPPIPPSDRPSPLPPLDPGDPPSLPAPGKPSPPVVEADVNLLRVAWDGLLASGASAIDDDFGTLEVAIGSAPAPTDVVDRAEGAADGWYKLLHGPVPLDTTWYVRARILNRWGTAGPWSDEAVVVVAPLVDPQQFDDALAQVVAADEWITQTGADLSARLNTAFGEGEAWSLSDAFDAIQAEIDSAAAAAAAAVTGSVIEYAAGTSETDPPSSGWSTATPTHTPGGYIWMRTLITYGSGDTVLTSPVLLTGNPGPPGADGTSVQIAGRVPNAAALPTNLGPSDAGKGWITEDDGHLHVWSGTAFTDVGRIQGPPGEDGTPGTPGVSIVAVTPYYRRQPTEDPAPAPPTDAVPTGWVTTEPGFLTGHVLYRTERVSYSNGAHAYTAVSVVTAWTMPRPHESTAAPTSSDIMPAGTRWTQRDSAGREIGIWVQQTAPQGGSWAQRGLDLTLLRATEGILDSAVIEKLYAEVVRSRLITADMMMLGRGNNHIVDPYLDNAAARAARHTNADFNGIWGRNPTTALNWYGNAGLPAGTAKNFYFNSTDGLYNYDEWVTVEGGQVWRIKLPVFTAGGGSRLTALIRSTAGVTSYIPLYDNLRKSDAYVGTGTYTHDIEWTVPAGTAQVMLAVQFAPSATTAYLYGGVSMTRATDGSLLVDGTILPRHVNTQSLAAALAEIMELRFENAVGGNLSVLLNLAAGGKIVAGDPNATRTEMSSTGIEYWGTVGEAANPTPQRISRFGRDLQFESADGQVYGINETGDANVRDLSTAGDPHVAGTPLLGTLALRNDEVTRDTDLGHFDQVPFAGNYGEILGETDTWPWSSGGEKVVLEVTREQQAGRAISVMVAGKVRFQTVDVLNAFRIRIRKTEVNLPTTSLPARPMTSSPLFSSRHGDQIIHNPGHGAFTMQMGLYAPSRSELARWLITIENLGRPAEPFRVEDMRILFHDLGPMHEVTLDTVKRVVADNVTPPPAVTPKKTYTSRWFANSISRAQGSNPTSSGDRAGQALQGWTSGMSSDPFHTILGFTGNAHHGEVGRTISNVLSGATIERVRFRTSHVAGFSGIPPRLGIQSSSSAIPVINQTVAPTSPGQTLYHILNSTFRNGLASGMRYLTFGPGSRTNQSYASYHGTSGGNSRRVELEIVYTR